VLVIAGSQRRHNSCPGLDSKARALMLRMAAALPAEWQIDTEDLGNQHGKPKIQACNACVSSSMALCVYPCNCYGPRSTTQPDLMWDLDLYGRLARADAWAFIGPTNWYGPTTNFKLMFDRLVCAAGGNPRPDLIDKKDTLKAQALERSPQWRRLTKKPPGGPHGGLLHLLRRRGQRDGRGRPAQAGQAQGLVRSRPRALPERARPIRGWSGSVATAGSRFPTRSGPPACSARASPTPTTRPTT
jgi:hypothetical protein